MSISLDDMKKMITDLSQEANELTNELVEIDGRKSEIQHRLIQIVGAIETLNKMINNATKYQTESET